MPMFACIEWNPKLLRRPHYRTRPRICTSLAWFEEFWAASRRLGDTHWNPHKSTDTGAGDISDHRAAYDTRVVSPDDEAEIHRRRNEIKGLQAELQQYITNQFRTWHKAEKHDCEKLVGGKTKEEATADCKRHQAEDRSAVNVEAERRTVNIINRTLLGR